MELQGRASADQRRSSLLERADDWRVLGLDSGDSSSSGPAPSADDDCQHTTAR